MNSKISIGGTIYLIPYQNNVCDLVDVHIFTTSELCRII